MSALAATYKFTAEEYYRLYEVGLLDAHDRIELLNGELIIMHAIGYRHAQAVTNLTAYFGEQAHRQFRTDDDRTGFQPCRRGGKTKLRTAAACPSRLK